MEYGENRSYQRNLPSASAKKNNRKNVQTDFMTRVIVTQLVVFSIISLVFFGFYKTQSDTYRELRSVYNSIMKRDMTVKEITDAVKSAMEFISAPQGIKDDKAKQSDEGITAISDEELSGSGGEDLLYAKEKTSFAPFYLSVPMIVPVEGYRITSGFGYRVNPVTEAYGFHSGLDMAVPQGTDIRAAFGGTVEKAEYSQARGNYIVLASENGIKTVYCHCSELEVAVGDRVTAGSVIAKVGSTGQATGPHLHFEIIIGGIYHNPSWVIETR